MARLIAAPYPPRLFNLRPGNMFKNPNNSLALTTDVAAGMLLHAYPSNPKTGQDPTSAGDVQETEWKCFCEPDFFKPDRQ
jgi:hypothetical protein